MQFTYDIRAKEDSLNIDGENFKHIIKARRSKVGQCLAFRNLKDDYLYFYEIVNIGRKDALLSLVEAKKKVIKPKKSLHLIWSMVDPKTIEKQLPFLNEMGVDKISFFYGEFSQKNFKLNFEKLEKILINSSQQCGRSNIISLDMIENIDDYLKANSDVYMLNFSTKQLEDNKNKITKILVGCEGGFSKTELEKFSEDKIVGFNTNLILKSQTAITAIAAKILL